MRGREFLDVLPYLEGLESEASLRTRIGRCYCAAFLEARAWRQRHLGYVRTRSASEHAEIPRLLRTVDPALTASLAFLRGLRNSADYNMELSPETVALQVLGTRVRAKSAIARLDALTAKRADS